MNANPRIRQFKLYSELEAISTKKWLVKDLLGEGEASALYGMPGCGKSALAEDMGLHIAAGLPWHGRPVKCGAVLYVALERRLLVERRAIAFRERHSHANLPFAVMGGVHDFRQPQTADILAQIVKEVETSTGRGVVLITIDTISRALAGGDENSSKDMGAIVATTARLQEATKAHVQWLHHVPIDSGERLRGHSSLLGALDCTINVEKSGSGPRTATVIKVNDAEEGQRVAFTLESVTIGPETTAPVVVPAEQEQRAAAGEPRLTPNQRVMYLILRRSMPDGLSVDDWNERARVEGIGVKRRSTLLEIRDTLETRRLVREFNGIWRTAD